MERRIGEKFTIDEKTYIVKRNKYNNCSGCAFGSYDLICRNPYISKRIGYCSHYKRTDNCNVIFEELKEETTNKTIDMKEFELRLAKQFSPVQTRNGRRVRIITFNAKTEKPIIALVERLDGEEDIVCYSLEGTCSLGKDYDLMMVTTRKQGWVNVYRRNNDNSIIIANTSQVYSTKEAALENKFKYEYYIGTFPFEWEE